MMLCYILSSFILVLLIMVLFFFFSKNENWDKEFSSGFECGFSSYLFSWSSFCVHYFLVALIFLFLDLELAFIFNFFMNFFSNFFFFFFLFFFIFILLLGIFLEWKEGILDWIY